MNSLSVNNQPNSILYDADHAAVSLDKMLVADWMTSPARVISASTALPDAYDMMTKCGIRRLPVMEDGRLVGIVTLGDLREARPSLADSLSIYELNYRLAKLTVRRVMTFEPYTVTATTPITEAARIMLEQKIGGLPVVNAAGGLVGIISESDLFRALLGLVGTKR